MAVSGVDPTRLAPIGSYWTRWVGILGVACWIAGILISSLIVLLGIRLASGAWLYDWHVYAAGATDLLQGKLYEAPLRSAFPLPVESFNYPPLAALVAIPLLVLPDQLAGTIWVILNIAAVAGSALFLFKVLGVDRPWSWAGIAFALYSVHPWAISVAVGNNNPIVLLLVTGFVYRHVTNHPRSAGILLGAAIGMKLWPAALLPLLIRERRWRALGWTLAVVGAVGALTVVWLGLDVIGAALASLQVRDEIEPGRMVLGVTWLRETFEWWPWWGGFAVAGLIMAIPARGLAGLGLGVLAGLAAVPNLWAQYLPAIAVGFVLLATGIIRRSDRVGPRMRDRSTQGAELS